MWVPWHPLSLCSAARVAPSVSRGQAELKIIDQYDAVSLFHRGVTAAVPCELHIRSRHARTLVRLPRGCAVDGLLNRAAHAVGRSEVESVAGIEAAEQRDAIAVERLGLLQDDIAQVRRLQAAENVHASVHDRREDVVHPAVVLIDVERAEPVDQLDRLADQGQEDAAKGVR